MENRFYLAFALFTSWSQPWLCAAVGCEGWSKDCVPRSGCDWQSICMGCDDFYGNYQPVEGSACETVAGGICAKTSTEGALSCVAETDVSCSVELNPSLGSRPEGSSCGDNGQCLHFTDTGLPSSTLRCAPEAIVKCLEAEVGEVCSKTVVSSQSGINSVKDACHRQSESSALICVKAAIGACYGKQTSETCSYLMYTDTSTMVTSKCDDSLECLDPEKGACYGKAEGEDCEDYNLFQSKQDQGGSGRRRMTSKLVETRYTGGTCQGATSSKRSCEGATGIDVVLSAYMSSAIRVKTFDRIALFFACYLLL